MIVLGVDIGIAGAIAILEDGELVDAVDMPCLSDGPARRRSVNAPLLAEIVAKSHATLAYVEYAGPRPQEGAVGAFAFGRSPRGRRRRPGRPWASYSIFDATRVEESCRHRTGQGRRQGRGAF